MVAWWISTLSAMPPLAPVLCCKSCTWPLTSPLSVVCSQKWGQTVWLQIKSRKHMPSDTQTGGERSMSGAIFSRIQHGNSPWSSLRSSLRSSPWTVHSSGFTLTRHGLALVNWIIFAMTIEHLPIKLLSLALYGNYLAGCQEHRSYSRSYKRVQN